jgi:prolipoprotein diacylglyceryltransferase
MIPFPEGISPDIFTISLGSFRFTLYWYALAYVVGILAWWRIAARPSNLLSFGNNYRRQTWLCDIL